MRKTAVFVLMLLVCAMWLCANDELLYKEEQYGDCKSELLQKLGTETDNQAKATLLWKLSRVQVSLGDLLDKEDKDGRFAAYEEGISYAEQSIALKPSAMAYLWKSSNTGRWGQTKGPLDSLGKAKGMKEDLLQIVDGFSVTDSAETWYVLACLYDQLPGSPISFGNKTWAVSYLRAGVDSIPSDTLYPGHYLALAEMLYARNWDVKKRVKNIAKMENRWNGETILSEKYKYYEGREGVVLKPFYSSVTLEKMSDRQEASMLVRYALDKYAVWPEKKASMNGDIASLEDLWETWT
jgi:hypothetical protein